MKKMLIETCLSELPEKPLVFGLGMAGWGQSHIIKYRQSENLHICGDETSEIADDNPPLAPRVGIVANMQANTVLEILLSK
jgi:sulfur carrier protein ThiS adenylyltransferase